MHHTDPPFLFGRTLAERQSLISYRPPWNVPADAALWGDKEQTRHTH